MKAYKGKEAMLSCYLCKAINEKKKNRYKITGGVKSILLVTASNFVLLIVPSRYFCGGSFCFMSWCLFFFCAVGALCMFSLF